MGLTLEGKDKNELCRLTKVAPYNKSTYASWIPYFGEGKGSRSKLVQGPVGLLPVLVRLSKRAKIQSEHLFFLLKILHGKGGR